MTTTLTRRRVTGSIIAGSILAAPLAGLFASPAFAAGDNTKPAQPDAVGGEATVTAEDTAQLGDNPVASLTIHKLHGVPDSGDIANGKKLDELPDGASGVAGVGYKVSRVDVDLTTPQGWEQASKLNVASAKEKLAQGEGDTKTVSTNEKGEVKFDGLKLGLYLVEETTPAEGTIAATPFLAYLPSANADEQGNVTGWNTDVHVYPKTNMLGVEKTLNSENITAGSEGTYQIISLVPTSLTKESAKNKGAAFEIHDFLESSGAFVGKDQAIKVRYTKGYTPGENATGELKAGEDYTVTGNDATGVNTSKDESGRQHIAIKMTKAGLEKIAGASSVVVDMEAEFGEPDADGITTNVVRTLVNDGRPGSENIIVSNADKDHPKKIDDPISPEAGKLPGTQSRMATIDIDKVARGDHNKKLGGAEFQLWLAHAGLKTAKDVTSAEGAKKLEVSHQDHFTTDKNGEALIKGVSTTVSEGMEYYLIETKAPEGYIRPDVATPVTFDDIAAAGDEAGAPAADGADRAAGDKAEGAAGEAGAAAGDQAAGDQAQGATTTAVKNVTIENFTPGAPGKGEDGSEDTPGFLPFTGGAGVGALLAAGVGVAGVGAAVAAKRGKKDDEDEVEITA